MIRTGLIVLVSIALLACKKEKAASPPPPSPAPAPTPAVDDSLFVIARPVVARVSLPARFTAPLPASPDEATRGAYPPRPFIRAALDANTYKMRERFVDALTRAAAAGPISLELTGFFTGLVGYGVGADTCKWLAQTGANPSVPAPAREVAWKATTRCHDPSFASALERDDVPDSVIVEWYFHLYGADEMPYSERVARAAANVARTAKNDFDARQVGFVFARMKSDPSIAAVTKLQSSISDAHRRALVGLGMLRSKTPAGKAIGERSCKHPKVKTDAMCRPDSEMYAGGAPKKPSDLAGLIEYGEPTEQLIAKFPRDLVLAELARCAETGRDYRRRRCFDELLAVDRPAGLALAKQLSTNDDARLAAAARSLVKYPDVASAEKALRDLGFALDKPAAPRDEGDEERAPVSIQDVLVARGRSHWFDAETGMFPNEHDALLADLAALAKPTLDAVVFEEVPPSDSDADMDRGTYKLHAYVDGMRYSLDAENHGDWYDVEAVVGLVNALLVAKKSDTRLAILPTGDQTVIVVAGPARAIKSLVDTKLLDLGGAADSERVGKEFEDKVFDSLKKEGDGEVLRDVRIPTP